MVFDKNPSFGKDEQYETNALRVAEVLWKSTGGDLTKVPQNYLDTLDYEYSDGTASLLHLLNKVNFDGETTYEEFTEVVEHLIRVDPAEWPFSESILEIQKDKLLYEIEPEVSDFSEFDWDFASPRDTSDKVEMFLKKVIASVYTDGVTSVTDKDGNPPNARNNYLMSPDGQSFSGVFHDAPKDEENDKHFPFVIREKKNGNWEIRY